MPNANECELARVYVRNQGGVVSEESIKDNLPFEIVLEAEAGTALLNGGGQFQLRVFLTDMVADITVPAGTALGAFHTAAWPTEALQQVFARPAPGAGNDDHVFKAFGVLQAGLGDPIVDYEESDVFIVTAP
jgi:hypothetical protein